MASETREDQNHCDIQTPLPSLTSQSQVHSVSNKNTMTHFANKRSESFTSIAPTRFKHKNGGRKIKVLKLKYMNMSTNIEMATMEIAGHKSRIPSYAPRWKSTRVPFLRKKNPTIKRKHIESEKIKSFMMGGSEKYQHERN